jgi:hypothetical protein
LPPYPNRRSADPSRVRPNVAEKPDHR